MDVEKFRTSFPEFADVTVYPKSTIAFWADLGAELISQSRWRRKYQAGLFLFVAHNLVLAGQNARVAAAGGAPGRHQGAVSSKTVGSVSVSYDTSNIGNPKDGVWNLTTYGQQYRDLMRLVGTGGYVVS